MQTKIGAAKAKANRIEKLGGVEAYNESMRANGKIGGAKSRGGGYAFGDNGRKFGSLGGHRSKRGYKFLCETDEYMEYMDKSNDHYGETVKFYK